MSASASRTRSDSSPRPDPAEAARLRRQALDWLRADLAVLSHRRLGGPPAAKADAAQSLRHWKADADLAAVRDPDALAHLPEPERAPRRALWAEVDAVLPGRQPASGRPPAEPIPELPAGPQEAARAAEAK